MCVCLFVCNNFRAEFSLCDGSNGHKNCTGFQLIFHASHTVCNVWCRIRRIPWLRHQLQHICSDVNGREL